MLSIGALRQRLAVAPAAADLVELAGRGLGDRRLYERFGGDGVGTDDYEAVVDGWPLYRDLLGHADPAVRTAAAYLLALLVEPAEHTLPALEAAALTATDEVERASMIVAAGRLRASAEGPTSPGDVWRDGLALAPLAAAAPQPERGARALAQVMALPEGAWFHRKCRPEVGEALAGLSGLAAGPWGDGNLGVLAEAFIASLSIEEPGPRAAPGYAPAGQDEYDEDDEDDADEDDEDDADEGEEWEDFGDDDVDDPYTQSRPERRAPLVRLAGLRDVQWSSLDHAYGRADGVPGMIDALSSPDPDDRAWGLEALDASIHHQGSVYPASTAAVPFLIALAGDPRVEDRHDILVLLAGIAVHEPSQCLVDGARQMRSEAFDAVAAGGPTYAALLADPDPRVRNAAAFALAFVEPVAAGAPAALRAALAAETDRRARAGQLLALGYLSRYREDDGDASALAPYLTHRCRLLRTAAAIGLVQMHRVRTHPAAPPAEALAVLDEARATAARVVGFWPWNDGDLRAYAATIRAAVMTTEEHLADLAAARAAGDADRAETAARSAFWSLFDDGRHGPLRLWLPEEIDEPRRAVLHHFVETAPHELMSYWDHAEAVGLPSGVRDTRRLLGLERGPLDATVTVDGRPLPLWAVLHDLLWGAEGGARAARLAALDSLDAPSRVAVVDDALDRAFALGHRHITDAEGDFDYRAQNDHTSRYLILLADLLGGAGADGSAEARRIAAGPVEAGRRDPDRATLAALVLARAGELAPEFDSLIDLDQPPAGTYRLALREVFGHLPRRRRLALVGEPRLFEYTAYRDPRGEVRRWSNTPGWQWIDLIAPEDAAPLVIAAIREWERHRAAGDDRAAEPVGGSVTSSIEQRSEDEPFPRERAIEALGLAGAAAVAAIDAALADGSIADRDLLLRARAAAAT